ncbi:MAG TPA: FAD-dependent oxidoreductase, partial [Ilumatobacteraceae bacterium]
SVRPCINCYVCVEQNFFDASAICAVNPALGNESAATEATAITAKPRHLVVVGAGPAGLETARVADGRGHRVTLLERAGTIGGETWFASLSGSANEMLLDWLAHEVEAAGRAIDLRLGCDATPAEVTALEPDVVVVATGASGLGAVRALITGGAVGARVAIIGGDLIGLSLATFLAKSGHTVTVLEPSANIGIAMAMPRRWTAVAEAMSLGVTLVRNAEVVEVATGGLTYRVAGVETTIEADEVLTTNDRQPDTALADQLRAAGLDVHIVGDAADLGYLAGAIHGAHRVAAKL